MNRVWPRLTLAALLLIPAPVAAERPAMRAYTTTDGLAHDRISWILADSRGFVWFGTANGLSRFDGARFASYGTADGLSSASITAIVEAGDEYFIGTNGGGVGWYRPQSITVPSSRFQMFAVDGRLAAANRVNVLLRGRGGRVWVGTDGGLFELVLHGPGLAFRRVSMGTPSQDDARTQVWALVEDTAGRVWMGSSHGLAWRDADGTFTHLALHPAQGADHVYAIAIDPAAGGVWAAHDAGLFFVADRTTAPATPVHSAPADRRRYLTRDGLPADKIRTVFRSSDGTLWIGTDTGVATFRDHRFAIAVPSVAVSRLAEDRHGHIWLGVISGGAIRLALRGLTSFSSEDGLPSPYIVNLSESRDGRLGVVTRAFALSLFDGARFTSVRPNVPLHVDAIGRRPEHGLLRRQPWRLVGAVRRRRVSLHRHRAGGGSCTIGADRVLHDARRPRRRRHLAAVRRQSRGYLARGSRAGE